MAVVARSRGAVKPKKQPPPPRLPPGTEDIWDAWYALHRARGGTGWGELPISFEAIAAWQGLMDIRLQPWEIEAVRLLDDAYLEASSEQALTTPTKPAS
jgi:hypothetical protein